jgi:hypothetical protein
MQNSETCMFCRYRKARIAACCAANRASPAQQEGKEPAHAAPSSAPDLRDRTLPQPARQEVPHFA